MFSPLPHLPDARCSPKLKGDNPSEETLNGEKGNL